MILPANVGGKLKKKWRCICHVASMKKEGEELYFP